ncbi:MAG: PIG-L deacetylase family protein [Acidobacteriaceae bacterium]
MADTTRRSILKMAGASVAALSLGGETLNATSSHGAPEKEGKTAPRVMAIAAHPGDAFFVMGAPVAVATHSGGQGFLVSLSLGEKGSTTISPEQYGAMQKDAATKAAGLLGAGALFLQYGDGSVPDNDEAAFAVCDFIRQHKPDIVVTHWKGSEHKDHQACHHIVLNAIFYAAIPGFVRQHPAHSVRCLYFADNWEDAREFAPDTYLDITPIYDQWMNACAVFPMWRGETGFRYNDYYSSRATGCGCLSGNRQAVALMSWAEQRTEHVRSL